MQRSKRSLIPLPKNCQPLATKRYIFYSDETRLKITKLAKKLLELSKDNGVVTESKLMRSSLVSAGAALPIPYGPQDFTQLSSPRGCPQTAVVSTPTGLALLQRRSKCNFKALQPPSQCGHSTRHFFDSWRACARRRRCLRCVRSRSSSAPR